MLQCAITRQRRMEVGGCCTAEVLIGSGITANLAYVGQVVYHPC
jgi:hypothetical protein